MPNATVRANARTLPETTNRRAPSCGLLLPPAPLSLHLRPSHSHLRPPVPPPWACLPRRKRTGI
jgi:hypothetical protein